MMVMLEIPAGVIDAVKTVMECHTANSEALSRIASATDHALSSPVYNLELELTDPDTAIGIEWAVAKCIMAQELKK